MGVLASREERCSPHAPAIKTDSFGASLLVSPNPVLQALYY